MHEIRYYINILTRIPVFLSSLAICKLPVDQGNCEGGYHKRWYFDDDRGECIAFIYSGCGGNFNNFKSFQSCIEYCRELLPQTEPRKFKIARIITCLESTSFQIDNSMLIILFDVCSNLILI